MADLHHLIELIEHALREQEHALIVSRLPFEIQRVAQVLPLDSMDDLFAAVWALEQNLFT